MSEEVVAMETVAYALAAQGGRPAMEDTHVFEVHAVDGETEVLGAIFDGHRGDQVAKYAASRFVDIFHDTPHDSPAEVALAHALEQIHKECALLPVGNAGACAAAFHITNEHIITANLGDVEIVYVSDILQRGDAPAVQVLTTIHRLDNADEILRVYHAGGMIQKPYFFDSRGTGLMPTRSLGDTYLDNWGMSHDPEIGYLNEHGLITKLSRPGFLVAACDGFWDVVKAAELPNLVLTTIPNAQHVADILFKEALEVRGTTDNLTVIVVRVE